MIKAARVFSTPPTNTPIDSARRRFLTVAAGASVASVGTLAVVAMPAAPDSPACAVDPVFHLIAEKLAADIAHCEAIDAQGEIEGRGDFRSGAAIEAQDDSEAACHAVNVIDWRLATTPPTTLAGVAAVLRFANESSRAATCRCRRWSPHARRSDGSSYHARAARDAGARERQHHHHILDLRARRWSGRLGLCREFRF